MVFQDAPRSIQRLGKSAIREAIFRPESAGLQRRAPAGIEDPGRKWQAARDLLDKTNASVARPVDFG